MNLLSIKNILYHFSLGAGYDLSYIEAIGTFCGLLCIWLATKEKRVNFYFGLVNVTLFAIIFYQIQLYASLLLQMFFLAMNLYGLYAWSSTSGSNVFKIRWLSYKQQLITICGAAIAIVILSFYINEFFMGLTFATVKVLNFMYFNVAMPQMQADPYPLMDAAVTVLSIIAMVMMTRKLVENWLIWVVINIISIVLYAKQGVYFMSLEYVLLLLIAARGSFDWMVAARKN